MTYPEGTTVTAARNGDTERIYVYGDGVYVGDRLMPGTDPEHVPEDDYEAISSVLAEEDVVPIEEHRFLVWYDQWVRDGVKVKQTREEVIAKIGGDRARPMADRVRDLYLLSRMNPCIYLDSGDVVYGFQCWWGPVDQFALKMPIAERVLVPVPEGNGRWK